MLTEKITSRIAKEFPTPTQAEVETLLAQYGTETYHGEVVRVQDAILDLARGKRELVEQWVKLACVDYRDMLMQLR